MVPFEPHHHKRINMLATAELPDDRALAGLHFAAAPRDLDIEAINPSVRAFQGAPDPRRGNGCPQLQNALGAGQLIREHRG